MNVHYTHSGKRGQKWHIRRPGKEYTLCGSLCYHWVRVHEHRPVLAEVCLRCDEKLADHRRMADAKGEADD